MNKEQYNDKINQLYIEIICNIIRKQNIDLLEKIGEEEMLPIREIINKYVITKTQVKNILTKMSM
jgi:TRAP-type mannitol/chloroaromatic compound transport system substrate-binding protein